MKFLFFLILINYSLSYIVFPFKIRENNAVSFKSPVNQTEIPILEYLFHILNDFEFVSEIEVGNPKQNVELKFNFNDNYLTILYDTTSTNPYYYNLSSSYKEIKINDEECSVKVNNSHTIREIFHMKNKFYDNLNDYLSSKDEVAHEFTIIFSKNLPTLEPIVPNKFFDSNSINIGLRFNTKYNDEHGIYKPFLNEVKEQGYIENFVYFLHYFNDYKENLYNNITNSIYDGLIIFGKYPHELIPNKYDIKNLYWTTPFLTHSKYINDENILWGVKFNQVYIDYGDNKKEEFEYLRGIFDLNVEYIFPPYKYYETIKNFFRPLRKICFIDSNARFYQKDDNIYRMIYCDYEEFGKKYLKTFPKLVFKLDDFDEEFEFTYKDLFKPIYNNKYYLFLIFTGRFWRASEYIVQFPNYPWTLGRIFFKKYQFVFDAANKKVGYYKNKNAQINNNMIDTKLENINDEEEIKKNNGNNLQKENKRENKADFSIIIFIFIIIMSLILVIVIGICYESSANKQKRKRRVNELIDEPEYISKE